MWPYREPTRPCCKMKSMNTIYHVITFAAGRHSPPPLNGGCAIASTMVWAWCRKRLGIAPAVGTSPKSLPHSSNGRLVVMMAKRFSYRRIITSKRCSPAFLGELRQAGYRRSSSLAISASIDVLLSTVKSANAMTLSTSCAPETAERSWSSILRNSSNVILSPGRLRFRARA
jgi:hypothetical protein